jgi:hypothetical protein
VEPFGHVIAADQCGASRHNLLREHHMSFTKILLAGTAVCALCTAPALARQAPDIHLGSDTGLAMKVGAPLHYKSSTHLETLKHTTETVTFSASISKAADYKVKTILLAETWYQGSTCTQPAVQHMTFAKTSSAARLSHGTSTGTIAGCGSTIFTFQDLDYMLTKRDLTSDTVPGKLIAPSFNGYRLTLIFTVDVTITA